MAVFRGAGNDAGDAPKTCFPWWNGRAPPARAVAASRSCSRTRRFCAGGLVTLRDFG